jgi:hypothetical protein
MTYEGRPLSQQDEVGLPQLFPALQVEQGGQLRRRPLAGVLLDDAAVEPVAAGVVAAAHLQVLAHGAHKMILNAELSAAEDVP